MTLVAPMYRDTFINLVHFITRHEGIERRHGDLACWMAGEEGTLDEVKVKVQKKFGTHTYYDASVATEIFEKALKVWNKYLEARCA